MALFIFLALTVAGADDADLQGLVAQSRENAPEFARVEEARIKLVTAQLATVKKARINPRQGVPKQKSDGGFSFATKADKEASVATVSADLESRRARLARIKAGKEICLPVLSEQPKPGRFYVLKYGVEYEVRDRTSCYWDIGGSTSAGGAPSPILCLLRGLDGLDREKPETLKLYGTIFKAAGTVSERGRTVYLFDRIDRAAAEAALAK